MSSTSVSFATILKRLLPAAALSGLMGVSMVSSGAAAPGRLFLDCEVTGALDGLAADFEHQFCSALAAALERDLKLDVSQTKSGNGDGAHVRITVRNAHLADVTISTGQMSQAGLVGAKTTTSQLNISDRELSSGAARTLVYPIASQLGLVK